MSIDQSRPAASAGTSDPFLAAMSQEAARADEATRPRAELGEMGVGSVAHSIARSVGFGVLLIALMAGVVALVDGARRSDTADLASTLASSPASVSMPVQSPFVDTTVRLVENQAAALWQQDDGSPAVRLANTETAAVAALVNEDGIPVALGVVPPGLSTTPNRLLISPMSTALTIAATHPDVLSGTATDSLGRLAVVARSGGFSSLSNLVDGSTPVDSLGPDSITAIRALGASLNDAVSALEPTCTASEVPAPGIVRCSGSNELQNTGLRTVPVLGATGEICGLVPPARFAASAAEQAAIVAMIADGLPFDAAAAAGTVAPGAFDPTSSCGGTGEIPTQADAAQILQWRGQTELVDVAVPLARILGVDANVDNQALRAINVGAADSDAPGDRLSNAMVAIGDPAVHSLLGLNRQAQPADIPLDGLVQSTIARLYE